MTKKSHPSLPVAREQSLAEPSLLGPLLKNIPLELTPRRQWVAWRYVLSETSSGTCWRKLPVCPATGRYARPNTPATWDTFERACRRYEDDHLDGVGFMFSENDPYVGLDLDNCRDPRTGQIDAWAREHVQLLDTYTEVSPSGTGLKCIARGTIPAVGRRRGKFEIYDKLRYFALTGRIVDGLSKIAERSVQLAELHQRVFGDLASAPTPPTAHNSQTARVDQLPATDQQIICRASAAKNGGKFKSLWAGDTSQNAGDQSVADLAICRILAFWCGPRPDRIDRLFRQSKLYRPKWDQAHFADGRTYGEATVAKAIESQDASYCWRRSERTSGDQ